MLLESLARAKPAKPYFPLQLPCVVLSDFRNTADGGACGPVFVPRLGDSRRITVEAVRPRITAVAATTPTTGTAIFRVCHGEAPGRASVLLRVASNSIFIGVA